MAVVLICVRCLYTPMFMYTYKYKSMYTYLNVREPCHRRYFCDIMTCLADFSRCASDLRNPGSEAIKRSSIYGARPSQN